VTEPYRMLTARAEYRLLLRADNAETRLGDTADALGLLGEPRRARYAKRKRARAALESAFNRPWTANAVAALGVQVAADGSRRTAKEWLRFGALPEQLVPEAHHVADAEQLAEFVEDARYAPYLERQEQEVAELRANDRIVLPAGFDFAAVPGLSNEMVERLSSAQPATLGQASRIRGVTPAALSAILLHTRRAA